MKPPFSSLPSLWDALEWRRLGQTDGDAVFLKGVSDVDEPVLVFLVAGRRHALPVGDVERVVPAAEVTPLPDAPPDVRGAVKVGSEVAPVVDLRRRFGLPSRELELSDRFLLVRFQGALRALLVEAVEGVSSPRCRAVPETPDARVTLGDGAELTLLHSLASLLAPGGTEAP